VIDYGTLTFPTFELIKLDNSVIHREIQLFDSRENRQNCCHQRSDFKGKCTKFDFGWGSPRPCSWILGALLLRELGGEGRGGEWKGGDPPRGWLTPPMYIPNHEKYPWHNECCESNKVNKMRRCCA